MTGMCLACRKKQTDHGSKEPLISKRWKSIGRSRGGNVSSTKGDKIGIVKRIQLSTTKLSIAVQVSLLTSLVRTGVGAKTVPCRSHSL